jgi:hypothetical protein
MDLARSLSDYFGVLRSGICCLSVLAENEYGQTDLGYVAAVTTFPDCHYNRSEEDNRGPQFSGLWQSFSRLFSSPQLLLPLG